METSLWNRLWTCRRVQLKCDGTWWHTGGEVKGKLANGVGSQYSHATSEHGVSSITIADTHTSAASSRLNWRTRQFKLTRPFRWKTKSGFRACAITFQTQSNTDNRILKLHVPQQTTGHLRTDWVPQDAHHGHTNNAGEQFRAQWWFP